MLKVSAMLFLGVGVFLIAQIIMPLISYKFWELTAYNQNFILVDPTSTKDVLGVSVSNVDNFPAIISNNKRADPAPYSQFSVSIPKLGLEKLSTIVDTNTFENNLALLPGSALPGEKGNVFITGHSSLVQLFRPDNFKAIFANLPKIEKGDEINIEALGQNFTYQVIGLRIVDPQDMSVVEPPDDQGRYLTLMTCVPPGFNTKRLIVLARLK